MLSLLIADDQREIREGLCTLLPWAEYGIGSILEAADGEAALELLRRERPDVAFCDIRMPGLNGLELIRIATEEQLPTRFIFISGYGDFEYVKQALRYNAENYLLKPVDTAELAATVEQVIRKLSQRFHSASAAVSGVAVIQENLLNRFVSGGLSYSEFKTKATLAGIDLSDGSVAVVACSPCWNAYLYSQGKKLAEGAGVLPFFDDNGHCVFVFKAVETQDDALFLESIVSFAKRLSAEASHEGYHLMAGIGEPGRHFRSLGHCFETARRALDCSALAAWNPIQKYAECLPLTGRVGEINLDTIKAMTDYCSAGNRAMALSVASSLFNPIDTISAEYAAAVAAEAFFALLRKHDPTSGLSDALRVPFIACKNAISLSRSADEIRSALLTCLDTSLDECGHGSHGYGPLIDRIMDYVERNLAADLSLKTLGPSFGLSPAYIGAVFKDRTGLAFSDYLVERRIDRACRLLEDTGLKVSRIADICGFGNNANYFFTVFRKLTGTTPAEFRKSAAGKKQSPQT